MITLQEATKNIVYDNTKIGEKAPKIRPMRDIVNTTTKNYMEWAEDVNNRFLQTAPEFNSTLGVRVMTGISDAFNAMGHIPQALEIWGGEGLATVGDWTGKETFVKRGEELIKAANLELDQKIKDYDQRRVRLSNEDLGSFSYALGQGITNYGSMLALGYLGLGVKGGLAANAALELSSETKEGVDNYIAKTGDKELSGFAKENAGKEFLTTAIYTAGSTVMEKFIGFGSQMKLFKQPLKSKVKQILMTAASEGTTEFSQSLLNMGIDLADGTINWQEMPEQLRSALMEGSVGAVLGGGAGVASAMNHRGQAKAILRDKLKNTIPTQDLETVVDGIYDSASNQLSNVITTELSLSAELKAKHGEIYNSIHTAIRQAVEKSGAYKNLSEEELAQFEADTAKLFADQTLAEANKRGVLIEEVVKASTIVYDEEAGGIIMKDKTDTEGQTFEQAMYKSPLPDFGSFYDDIVKNDNTKDRYFTEDINGVSLDIPRNTIIHDNNKHNLSKEEWLGIFQALKDNKIKKAKIGDYSRMRGTPVKMIVDVNGVEYGVAFDHMKSGRNLVGSAFVLEDKGWINDKQKKSSQMEAYKPLPNSSSLGNSMSDIIATLEENVKGNVKQDIKGAYNTASGVLKIFEIADLSTLSHELAHFWVDNMWEYSLAGNASKEYMAQFKVIKDWLGIKDNQTFITRAQHEKFARGYEAYLLNGDLPEPMIKGVFDNYDRWLKKVYTDAGKLGVKLNADAVRFFQSMTTGKLPELAVMPAPAVNEDLKANIEAEVEKNVKAVEKVLNPTPIAPTTSTITTGEVGKSAVYTREIEENRRLDQMQAELPELEYNKVKLKEQLKKATDYVVANLAQAREVVFGRKAAPEGLLDTAIRIAYEEAMLAQGNTAEYLRALKVHSSAQTIRGQEISAERIARDDIASPKYWFDKLSYNRRAQVANKLKSRLKVAEGEETAIAKLNALIASKSKELAKLVVKTQDPAEQRRIMAEFAEKLKKEYKLESQPEELYQEAITAENAATEMMTFIEQTFGVSVAENEMSDIVSRLENIEKSAAKTEDKTGNPSIETLAMYDQLNKQVEAKTPSNPLAIATSIVGRAVMLASIKSPVLNVASNMEVLATEGLANRIAAKVQGKSIENLVDKTARNDYLRYALEAYTASGYNISTTENRNFETKIKGEKILTTQGEGKFRQLARYLETGVFKYSMGLPDSISKDLAFVDFVSLKASNLGKTKEEATAIFKDATLIEPKTEAGKEIRKAAIAYAHKATFTNNSLVAKVSLKVRDVLNTATGDLRLGDQVMPFVKTPANVVAIGAEYSMGVLYAGLHVNDIIADIKAGELSETSKNAITYATRNGLGVMLAALLSACFEPEDYIPEYALLSPSEKALMQDKNAVYNSVKIGDKYVSLDYFGPLGAVMSGILSAKRSMAREDSYSKAAGSFLQGTGTALLFNTPAFEAGKEAWDNAAGFLKNDSEKNLADLKAMTANYVMARTIPAIVSDLAKMQDDYERDTNRSVVDVFKSKIPYLREDLAPKYSKLSGQAVETADPWSVLLFGSRVKSEAQSAVNDEITRLYNNGAQASMSDPTRYGKLKELDDKRKPEIRQKFAKAFFEGMTELMKTRKYEQADDEERVVLIGKMRRKAVERIKKSYGIE